MSDMEDEHKRAREAKPRRILIDEPPYSIPDMGPIFADAIRGRVKYNSKTEVWHRVKQTNNDTTEN